MIDNHDDPNNLPENRKNFGIIKATELLPIHLWDRLEIRKVPLSYVIHENVQPDPVEVKVTNRVNGEYYTTITEELIIFTAHNGYESLEENVKVLQIL